VGAELRAAHLFRTLSAINHIRLLAENSFASIQAAGGTPAATLNKRFALSFYCEQRVLRGVVAFIRTHIIQGWFNGSWFKVHG
jgi:hypothetical protein